MGSLGWPPDVAMGADVNAILIAIEGRDDLLTSIFGKAPGASSPKSVRVGDWRAMVRNHNRQYRKPKRKGG